jgi:hypothetical protein
MVNQKMEDVMILYLIRHYPIHKVKEKTKFKRGIYYDNNVIYFLGNKQHVNIIKNLLIENLKAIFSYNDAICLNVLNRFL